MNLAKGTEKEFGFSDKMWEEPDISFLFYAVVGVPPGRCAGCFGAAVWMKEL